MLAGAISCSILTLGTIIGAIMSEKTPARNVEKANENMMLIIENSSFENLSFYIWLVSQVWF